MNFDVILDISLDPRRLHVNIPIFHQEMLYHWYNIRRNPTTLCDILDETLWLNKHIILGGLSVLYQELYEKKMTK